MDVLIPHQFIPSSLAQLQKGLEDSQYEELVTVDFSRLSFSKPTSMLAAGSLLRRWITIRRDLGLTTRRVGISDRNNAHSYLKHLGFFDYVGIEGVGKKVGMAKGNTRYLPIREVRKSDLEKAADEAGEKLIDQIVFLSEGLANVLAGEERGEVKNSFCYSIREVIRNALEHSQSESCFICGQRWVNGESEIAIVDEGIGIFSTLGEVCHSEESEVLFEAIKPGISRTMDMSEKENIYENSGFGLYVLSELGNSFGWFCIGSGQNKLMYEKHNKTQEQLKFDGTFVGLHLKTTPRSFEGVLGDIIGVGEDEAKTEGRHSAASAISKKV